MSSVVKIVLVFWQSAKYMRKQKNVMLVHMDEKWFYAVVYKINNKSITSLGVEPIAHNTHHKSHLHKVMVIATTTFIPNSNDNER